MSAIYDPNYFLTDHRKIRVPVRFAPIEGTDYRLNPHDNSRTNYVTHTPQAQRCPRCNELLAVGDSYHHHVFWCVRSAGVRP